MKILKYLTYSLVLSLLVVSCDKHEIMYGDKVPANMAEFQLHYFEPIINDADHYIDSVYVNDILCSSVKGNQLKPYNGVPTSGNKFFYVNPGEVNIKFYREDVVVYDQNVNLSIGKQNVIVHDLNKVPVVIDNQFPYWDLSSTTATAETFNTDSVTSIMFINLLYEAEGQPYEGKLQYQYQDVRTKEWKNVGEPVAFGEATKRTPVKVVKTTFNDHGSCRIDYRLLDENGDVLKYINSKGKETSYSDYWTGYIGYVQMHFYAGIRTQKTPYAWVYQWQSL